MYKAIIYNLYQFVWNTVALIVYFDKICKFLQAIAVVYNLFIISNFINLVLFYDTGITKTLCKTSATK
jgi:hypothetical protein